MSAAETVLTIALAVVYGGIAIPKLARIEYFKTSFEHLRMPARALPAVGATELVAAALLLCGFAQTGFGVAGSALIAVLMIGAVGTHLRAGDPPQAATPAVVLGLIAAFLLVLLA